MWGGKLHARLTTSCKELLRYHYIDGGPRTPMTQSSLQASQARWTSFPTAKAPGEEPSTCVPHSSTKTCPVWFGVQWPPLIIHKDNLRQPKPMRSVTTLSLHAQVCLSSAWLLPFTSTLGTFVWLAQKALYSLNRSA